MEKQSPFSGSTLLVNAQPPTRRQSRARRFFFGGLALITISYLAAPHFDALPENIPVWQPDHQERFKAGCVQPDPIFPSKDEDLDKLQDFIATETFRNASIARLSGAVQVKSESFDDLGAVGEDPRWEVFYDLSHYLAGAFPLVHEKLLVEKVNSHGLLYTWKGSDESLKPSLLMAHQDTVPVPPETIGAWKYPPWSGAYDGKYIWGRGSSDCKNLLIAELEAIELLLSANFHPKRTVLLSFGFDEECSGKQGAQKLSAFIHERYGDDGLAVIVDEGSGYQEAWGSRFFLPGTAEKGYTDISITVRMPGGHSSVPPAHTSIGVLSELITNIEANQGYPTRLDDENPYYSQLQCGAAYSPGFPKKLKKLLSHRKSSSHKCKAKPDYLALEAAKQNQYTRYLMQTSQAVDVITGGIKINALPERVTVTVNHRINIGETTQVVRDRLTDLAGKMAHKYNLTLHAFDGKEEPSSIILTETKDVLEVAPVTPTDASVDGPFKVFAGTTRAVQGEDVIVAPGIMTGNTDTRYYWALTKHIFRFDPGYDPEDPTGGFDNGIHTVNERVSVAGHINSVKWLTTWVRNMDEAKF
ncbi:hypothetical protein B0T14DRAFT_431214 [Immersiella caudata]|uniref:Peptidase M20 dimerisation domain-containing protein n=1 Tax=Immersiella caudata TaxID=314043 RepID=A0AA40C0J4_9PEZI|nr:hypothetical protein B0T14DRAFT_431214 [Immersiella caudata]